MNKINNLQDSFINEARKRRVQVTIHIVNGFQLKGVIKSFDNFTILLETEEKEMLVYKHAVTTITPSNHIEINYSND